MTDSDDEEDAMLIETNDNVPVRQLRGVALRKKSKVSLLNIIHFKFILIR